VNRHRLSPISAASTTPSITATVTTSWFSVVIAVAAMLSAISATQNNAVDRPPWRASTA
jgi:hypothetical protein